MSDAGASITHLGACHCGAVTAAFTPGPDEIRPRACQCDFCTARGSVGVSDPSGFAEITLAGEDAVHRYRFGHGSAEFLICTRCGTFVAAVMGEGDDLKCVLNARGFAFDELLARPTVPADFGAETPDKRTRRRARNWIPARLRLAG